MKRTVTVSIVLALIVSVAIGLAFRSSAPTSGAEGRTSTYQRIIDSGRIRVGYVNQTGGCDVDPKTGEVSGMFVDILAQMATNMSLEVEYVEEVGWGTMIAGLQTGRYDMMASPVWPNSNRAKQVTFSKPAYFSAIGIWVRQDESRFSPAGGWASLNNPGVKLGAIDGSTGETIAQTLFPKAKLVTYPELAAEGQIFLDVKGGKIDAFFEEPAKGLIYMKNNPGQIKNIAVDQPVKVFANVFIMPAEEYRLKEMLDTALEEVQNSGVVERIISKHEPAPNAYYRVALPYRSSQ